jgi:putative nucleotidyltransferase with HDIG domain
MVRDSNIPVALNAGPATLTLHLGRLYSLLLAIRRVNRALLTARSEEELFRSVCESLDTVDGIRFVWIGVVDRDKKEIRPAAQSGFEEGFLAAMKIRLDDAEHDQSPTSTAIRTGKPAVMRFIETDPTFALWRAEAMRRGYRSSVSLPLLHEGTVVGALNVYADRDDAFGTEEMAFLTEVAGDIGVGLRGLYLEQKLEHSLASAERMLSGTVQAIGVMAEIRDPYTAGHQRRVADLATAVGKEMGLSSDCLEGLHIAGLLHDVGKIAVPAEILTKPGKLSEYEFEIIKSHPGIGQQILKGVAFPWPVVDAVVQHHERLDGRGYPDHLKGEAIIAEARILAVSDVVEAMSSHRPYRAALGVDKALEEIARGASAGYDGDVVEACLRLFREKRFAFT